MNEDLILDMHDLYENAPCGYIFTDPNGTLLKVNSTFIDWVEYSKEELVNKMRFQDLLSIGSKIYYETHFSPLLKMQGNLNEIFVDIRGRMGTITPVLISSAEVRNEAGELKFIKSTIFNISERRRYEKELVNTKKAAELSAIRFEFLAVVQEKLQDFSKTGPAFQDVAELALKDFCDICIIDLHQDHKAQRLGYASKNSDLKIPFFKELPLSSHLIVDTDDVSEIEENLKPVLQAADAISAIIIPFGSSGILAFYQTQLGKKFSSKDLELGEALGKRLKTALETSYLQQDNIYTHQELLKTVRDLRQEKEIREKFVATITHDLRSPLTSVKLNLQIIQRKASDPENVEKMATRCLKSTLRVDRMIEDMLHANRLSAGEKLNITRKEMDIVVLAQEVLTDLTLLHGDRFVLDAPRSIKGKWDEEGLRRILENLCINAVKYGHDEAPIEILLEIEKKSLVISVHNKGEPIPESEQKILFDPYKRMVAHEQSGKKGWGLGLALVKGVTEAHGGTTNIISQKDLGTTFVITLPIQ